MSKKLNILQLINVRWYNACAHYAVSLSCALKGRGHKVIVAGDPHSPPILKAKELGLLVYEDLFLSYTSPWMIVYNIKRMTDLVERERIDIINAHRGEGLLVAALARSFFKRKVSLVRTRGDVRTPKANILNRYLNKKLTDKIITTCQVLKASYTKNLKIPENKVVNIGVGIDHDFFSPREGDRMWREKLTIPEGSLVVGILGRLSPVKGHKYFIRAAEYVLKQVPHTTFIICGEDAQISAEKLKETVKSANIEENFRFVGRIRDVREIISLFDVGVVSSVGSETICRVALEYMSLGKPVVGTYVNAIPEVVEDGINGMVVEPKNPQKLADAIIELLQDEQKRKEFGEKSRSIVLDKFTLNVFAQKTEEVYLSLLS
ncbi:MAG: glycosyltransferase family 4 protein [candidate division Zixibacteria bacterium]|nr:glycosyltransferase family 4 protein [candidate division Zixibacteria bacterium]